MKAYSKSEQSKAQMLDARVPYEPPTLTVMGKVEHLTAAGIKGPHDVVAFRNLL
jgi:hypothetical protein